MGDFEDFYREAEERAQAAGPEAVKKMENLKCGFAFASAVVQRRLELGLTQEDLAKRFGIDQADINRIEHGLPSLTFDNVTALVEALGLEGLPRPRVYA